MSRVKWAPPIVPFMSAKGRSEGMDDADPSIDAGLGTRPAPDTEYPPAVPLMDLIVGVTPVAPVHVTDAVPRPRGIVVRRAKSAPEAVEISAPTVAPATMISTPRRCPCLCVFIRRSLTPGSLGAGLLSNARKPCVVGPGQVPTTDRVSFGLPIRRNRARRKPVTGDSPSTAATARTLIEVQTTSA